MLPPGPSQWILQKIGAPESFSQPEALYRLALKMGMNAFTLTDHNTINGVLEVAHLPGVFISEEVYHLLPGRRLQDPRAGLEHRRGYPPGAAEGAAQHL